MCIYEVYRKSNRIIYYLRDGKAKILPEITLEGYCGLPSGLYLNRKGYGFGKKGVFLLSALKDHFAPNKKLELTITSKQTKKVDKTATKVYVTLPFQDVKNLLVRLGRINEDSNTELRGAVASFLSTKFPKQIKISTEDFEDLLVPLCEKQGYTRLTFGTPEMGKDLFVLFTIYDGNPKRTSLASTHDLQKHIKKGLRDTNWRLMSDGCSYRMGIVIGRLRAYEREEDLLKLVRKQDSLSK